MDAHGPILRSLQREAVSEPKRRLYYSGPQCLASPAAATFIRRESPDPNDSDNIEMAKAIREADYASEPWDAIRPAWTSLTYRNLSIAILQDLQLDRPHAGSDCLSPFHRFRSVAWTAFSTADACMRGEHDYAQAWRTKPKWVASRFFDIRYPNATLVQGDLIDYRKTQV